MLVLSFIEHEQREEDESSREREKRVRVGKILWREKSKPKIERRLSIQGDLGCIKVQEKKHTHEQKNSQTPTHFTVSFHSVEPDLPKETK